MRRGYLNKSIDQQLLILTVYLATGDCVAQNYNVMCRSKQGTLFIAGNDKAV